MAIDLDALWDFSRPEASEQRFRTALKTATGDDALILQTQIARTFGLRGDFEQARIILRDLEREVQTAGAEARVRHALELGRTYASAAHPRDSQTSETQALARHAYRRAIDEAQAAGLDGLAIDALHMMAFIDTAPADQLRWGRQALAIIEASSQPAAKRWEASIRNNLGVALHELGHYQQALEQFRAALAIRERGGNEQATRIARWMVAWTLRAMGKTDEALQLQLALERDNEIAGSPDPHVFEELALLYASRGDSHRADHYRQRKQAIGR